MTAKLTLTVGIPGSGKSFWADERHRNDPENVVVVERDRLREQIAGDRRRHTHETEVTDAAYQLVFEGLADGKHVIVSDTNLVEKFRRPWRELAHVAGAEYDEIMFNTSFSTCVERNGVRSDPVPVEVLERMQSRFEQYLDDRRIK